jgi:hypothetical protein
LDLHWYTPTHFQKPKESVSSTTRGNRNFKTSKLFPAGNCSQAINFQSHIF